MSQKPANIDLTAFPVIFEKPHHIAPPLAWVEHIPFSFFLVEVFMPGLFVELGTHSGNSYNAFCQAVKTLNLATRCFAIDTWKGDAHAGFYDEKVFAGLKEYQDKNYQDFSTLLRMTFDEGIEHFENRSIDLLHIDGHHTYEAVKHDFETWLPKLSDRAVVLFHDTNEKKEDFGVWKLWEELSQKYNSFNFLYGHGLGVLAVGKNISEHISGMIQQFDQNPFYASQFETLGKLVKLEHAPDKPVIQKTPLFAQLFVNTSREPDNWHKLVLRFEETSGRLVFNVHEFENIQSFRFCPLNDLVQVNIISIRLVSISGNETETEITHSNALNQGEASLIFDHKNPAIFFRNTLPENIKIRSVVIHPDYQLTGTSTFQAIIKENNKKHKNQLRDFENLKERLNDRNRQNETLTNTIFQLRSSIQNKHQINNIYKQMLADKNTEIQQLVLNQCFQPTEGVETNNQRNKTDYTIQSKPGVKPLLNSLFFRSKYRKHKALSADIKLIENSDLFDASFYEKENPDIDLKKMRAAEHYLTIGGFEKRNPSREFNSALYLNINSDVVETGINPLLHYIKFGKLENRRTKPLSSFGENEPDNHGQNVTTVSEIANINDSKNFGSLHHQIQLIKESGMFDERYYLQTYPDTGGYHLDLIRHFLLYGAKEGKYPNPTFDTSFYTLRWLTPAENTNPLVHWLTVGKKLGYTTNREDFVKEKGTIQAGTDILFVSHNATDTGAPKILLDIIEWVKTKTSLSFKILLLDGGPWLNRFTVLGECLVFNELKMRYPKNEIDQLLNRFTGPKPKLIYLNTIVILKDYKTVLGHYNAPVICHVHELQSVIEHFKVNTQHFSSEISHIIAASPPVNDNLVLNYKLDPEHVSTVFEWIYFQKLDHSNKEKNRVKQSLSLPLYKTIVFGCGNFDPRKGIDIFIETARQIKERGIDDIIFCWIGNTYNKHGQEMTDRICEYNLEEQVLFLGRHENPTQCFVAGDIFLLPSREDPFPLVCLEAANAKLPIVCFDKAGGMPLFVEDDAGCVVPLGDVDAMTRKVEYLVQNPETRQKQGERAYQKLLERHTADVAIPKVIKLCKKIGRIKPKVSVIVPNYNHGIFLEQRLKSIFDQTINDFEVIILDDASTDNSREIISKFEDKENVQVVYNKINRGSAFAQWAKGIALAQGNLIWIAESDDYCEPEFLASVLPAFDNPAVAISYANSNIMDAIGNIYSDFDEYFRKVDSGHWQKDYTADDTTEINCGLGVKNTIPNVSAVVFRKNENTPEHLEKASAFTLSGDWYFYLQTIKDHKINFVKAKLNYHRQHENTITRKSQRKNHGQIILDELQQIHRFVLENFQVKHFFQHKWERYLHEQTKHLYPKLTDINEVFPYDDIAAEIQRKQAGHNKSVVFVSNAADASGAPQNLLALARHFHENDNYRCITFSLTEGILLEEFKKLGEAYFVNHQNRIVENNIPVSQFLNRLKYKPEFAIVNTIGSGQVIPDLKSAGLRIVSFVHDYTYANGLPFLATYYSLSDFIVYSTEYMLKMNNNDFPIPNEKTIIIPQGLYKTDILETNIEQARAGIRKQYNLGSDDCIVLGCGSINPRKGVDIFINTAIAGLKLWDEKRNLHFFWLGGVLKSNSPDLYIRFLARDLVNSGQVSRIHFIESTLEVADYFAAADLFFLSSREDPFPTVVHEAMAAGLPVVAFRKAGGATACIERVGGRLVDYQNTHQAALAIIEMLNTGHNQLEEIKNRSLDLVTSELSYKNYYDKIKTFLVDNQMMHVG